MIIPQKLFELKYLLNSSYLSSAYVVIGCLEKQSPLLRSMRYLICQESQSDQLY